MPGLGSAGRRVKVKHFSIAVGWGNEAADHYFTGNHPNKSVNSNVAPLRTGNLLDIIGVYQISERDNVAITMPISIDTFRQRGSYDGNISQPSQLIPFTQRARGIGDVSIVFRRLLFKPNKERTWNAVGGLGMVVPTGNFNASAFYGNSDNLNPARKPVFHSIMPGQGGVGMYLEGQAFKVSKFPVRGTTYWVFANYLSQIMGRNHTTSELGTLFGTAPGSTPPSALYNSIADQYLVRVGSFIPIPHTYDQKYLRGFRLFMGMRWAGVPQHDFIGPNNGYRQPGMVIAAEPGFSYSLGHYGMILTTPIFFLQRSEADLAQKPGTDSDPFRNLATIPRWALNLQVGRQF